MKNMLPFKKIEERICKFKKCIDNNNIDNTPWFRIKNL